MSIVLLLASPGILIVNDDDKTKTSSTTSHQEEGHHDKEGQSHGAEGQTEEGHSHEGEGQSEGEAGFASGWPTMIGGLFLLGTVATAPVYQYTNKRRQDFSVSSVHLFVALLALFTAAVHLYLFLEHGSLIMLFAGLGFLGGIGLFFVGINRQYLYLVGILFTAVQILLWVNDGMPHLGSFGLIDKVVQTLLIVTLGYLYLKR
ncbi:DUF7475 family protein [Haladaptatus salinisoli]|uniref:DUF7475 family protein n=1 Tax=Haladaptatus salinisoli TaxID=2884876 RepID=UPI001D0B17DF|nr:hypothetical protein [Haladaptatus salinisoli]